MENLSHLDLLISLAVFSVILATFFFSNSQKYFTLREHAEYSSTVQRELDQLHERIVSLEQCYKKVIISQERKPS